MFLVTGTFKEGGKLQSYTSEEMSAMEVAKMFRLDVSEPVEFEISSRKKTKDRLNGGVRKPRLVNMNTLILGQYNGMSVSLQYYASKVPVVDNRNNVGERYLPGSVPFKEGRIFPADEMDKLVFLMLHPWCEQSPISGNTREKYFRIRNRVVESQAKMGLYEKISSIRSEILAMSKDPNKMPLLRRKAKGIIVRGQRVAIADYASDAEVAVTLIEKLEEWKTDFITAWTAPESDIRGMVQVAIDRGVIILNRVGDMTGAFWGASGELLCRFGNASDALTAVCTHILNNYDGVMPTLKQALDGQSLADKAREVAARISEDAETVASLDNLDNLIDRAVGLNIVFFNPAKGTVEWSDNGPGKKEIVKNVTEDPSDTDYWRTQFGEALKMNASLRDKLLKKTP